MGKLILILTILSLSFASVHAQKWCGKVTDEAFLDKVDEYKKMVSDSLVKSRGETIYIPINFHLVANSAGSGRLRIDKILDQINGLNGDYGEFDFHFYLDNDEQGLFTTIDNYLVFTNPANSSAQFLMNGLRDDNALNVFCAQSTGLDNALGVYFGGFDWIVNLNSQVNGFSKKLTHELGHLFGLPHTQVGFDSNENVWGDQTSELNIRAPVISPGGATTELVDGSNCNLAGDHICDTPPDFGFVQNGCEFWVRTDILDPDSVAITPLIDNFMTWQESGCENEFTPGQIDVISANYAFSARNYLRTSVPPTLAVVTSIQTLTFSDDNETIPNGAVKLTWDPVPNAQFYLVTMAERATFSSGFREYVVETNETTLDDLNDDDTYFWNVRPFNTYFTNPDVIFETRQFDTGLVSAVDEINGIERFDISPNPLRKNADLSIKLSNLMPITNARIELRDVTGKIIVEQDLEISNPGPYSIMFDTPGLASGVYILTLNSEQGIKSEKILAL